MGDRIISDSSEHKFVHASTTTSVTGHNAGLSTAKAREPSPAVDVVRMQMSASTAARIADALSDPSQCEHHARLLDQLWLRTVLIEQHRRTHLMDRPGFEERANRTLRALDPGASSGPTHATARSDSIRGTAAR